MFPGLFPNCLSARPFQWRPGRESRSACQLSEHWILPLWAFDEEMSACQNTAKKFLQFTAGRGQKWRLLQALMCCGSSISGQHLGRTSLDVKVLDCCPRPIWAKHKHPSSWNPLWSQVTRYCKYGETATACEPRKHLFETWCMKKTKTSGTRSCCTKLTPRHRSYICAP